MKRTSRMFKRLLLGALLLGISLYPFALPGDARAAIVNVNIASGADPLWHVYDANGKLISDANGNAIPPQNVCLNDTSPLPCPTGATKYGHVSPGVWSADLSPIPGATWIWAPNITGQTSPAANAEFTFIRDFLLCKPRQDGTIYIAVDDSAQVSVNGTPVLTTASNQLTRKTISTNLLYGVLTSGFPPQKNTITIKAKNAFLDWCVAKDNYQCNPAGMVFGTSFPDDEPSCIGSHGEVIQNGGTEHNCPPGQIGSTGLCTCGWLQPMNDCVAPPPTCGGINGKIYQLNESEALPCPAPKVGSASHTCQPNGWGPVDYSTCKMTCSGTNGKTYQVNESEAIPCPAPKVGSASHTCQSNGAWGTPNYSACRLPALGVGEMCASRYPNWVEYGTCPAGTDCRIRRTCSEDCPWWDWSGLFCSTTCLDSTDLYCDPY